MQSVSSAFTAEGKDTVRHPAHNLLVSWKKDSTLGNRTFTIGVSLIGGNDIIGVNPGAIGSPGNYRYFDESSYVTSLAWERGLRMPIGGLNKAYAEARLDNTSGRFTPRYMGGSSELFTAILPRRPMIINAGFDVDGIDIAIPQFAGVLDRQPQVNSRDRTIGIHAADYVDFFFNRFLDKEIMFTSQRTDEVLTTLFGSLGMSTAQYDFDYGINFIPFGLFEKGTRFSNIINQLVEAENGQLYQDESGIFKFENRQHWDSAPYTEVQKVIYTADVINAESPDDDHLINVVEILSNPRVKLPQQVVFTLSTSIEIPSNSDKELFVDFTDPMLEVETPVHVANSSSDNTGDDTTASVTLKSASIFAKAAKYIYTNNSDTANFITKLTIEGRPARVLNPIYTRAQDDSSVTAYEERPYKLENDYIQSESWADSFAQILLNDFSEIENLQRIVIRAKPELQFGDLISWQGRYWRVFDIKTHFSPSDGFIQELTLLQRTINSYFRIGISTIGGSDKIAP